MPPGAPAPDGLSPTPVPNGAYNPAPQIHGFGPGGAVSGVPNNGVPFGGGATGAHHAFLASVIAHLLSGVHPGAPVHFPLTPMDGLGSHSFPGGLSNFVPSA